MMGGREGRGGDARVLVAPEDTCRRNDGGDAQHDGAEGVHRIELIAGRLLEV
jgi:hypothetical protein